MSTRLLAGVEAGGTKVVCAVGTGPDDVAARLVVPTTTPRETLGRVAAFLAGQQAEHLSHGRRIEALGIASFGPLDLQPGSPTFGSVTTTPKPGWAGTDLVGTLGAAVEAPVEIDTDVNGAACGEHRWGAGRGTASLAYLTVGTGIGGGAVLGGEPLRGLVHPEMGHLQVRRHPDDDHAGSCPFHGDCVEGLAAGPAVAARAGRPGAELAGDRLRRAVDIEAWYLAQLVTAVVYVLSPERVVLGGGVLGMPGLLEAVRVATVERFAGALATPAVADGIDDYLVAPALGGDAGVLGAFVLAERALAGSELRGAAGRPAG